MKKLARFILNTVHGIYTILATYLLVFIIPFALAGFVFHLGFEFIAHQLEFQTVSDLWMRASDWLPIPIIWARILLFLPLHIATWLALRKPVAAAWPYVERAFDRAIAGYNWVTERFAAAHVIGEWLFTIVVTILLVPFVLQPTLVPTYLDADGWLERAANLIDGTATAEIANSVVGLYRKLYADPVVTPGLPRSDSEMFEETGDDIEIDTGEASGPITPPKPNGKQKLMDRWDPYIWEVAGNDPSKFAYIKAFMWVESGGRQYAVSHTGCAGLMQFCTGTAKDSRFRKIFGTGTVYKCDCSGQACQNIPRDLQRDMESGDPDAFERHKSRFPCEMTDSRFNPKKIIAAGGRYVSDLRGEFGGNIYLMYIGYNSGPVIARRVWNKVGQNPDVTISEVEQHLANALRPNYGQFADRRAAGLVGTHLPKLANAYDKYYVAGGKPPARPVPGVKRPADPDERPAPPEIETGAGTESQPADG